MSLNDRENNLIIENEDTDINNNVKKNNNISYKKDLWMYFESINTKFKKDRQKAKSLMYIISQKSILSEEYANNLELLYNQFSIELSYFIDEEHSKNNDNKKYSLDNFLNIFLENIKNESILFKNYSKLIKNKFLNILDQNIKIQYEMNSHLNELYKTYESKFKNVLQNIKNYKEIYEKAGKLLEDSKKKYEIMKEEIETKKEKNENNEADNLRYKKCEEENKQRIKEAKEKQEKYEDYIIIANKEREKYIELSEKIYDLAQKLDNEYIDLIKNNMSFLLKSKSDMFNIIFEENQNILKNIKLIDFNSEMEMFANSKFPKYALPKPFVYEQYTPYLYLRERNKIDLNAKKQNIYKNIVHDLNHLFYSDKFNINNIDNNNENINNKENKENKENNELKINIDDIDFIRNIVHEAWNSKKLDNKRINNLLKNEHLRLVFLRELNQYRHEGVFLLNNISYDNLTYLFNLIINISKKEKDYESIKTCMILSQTFYKSISNKNVLLQKEVMKNEIWKKKKFWEEMIDYSIKEQINSKKEYLVFLEENEEKREERVKNVVNSVLITFSYNMKLMNISLKERKEIIDIFIKKYKLDDNIIIHEDLDNNEIEEDILTESIASNLDIHHNDEERSMENNI